MRANAVATLVVWLAALTIATAAPIERDATAATAAGPPTSAVGPPTTCCSTGLGGGGASGGASPQVDAWVASATNGGLSRPSGTVSCGPWVRVAENVIAPGPPGPNGAPMVLFARVCDGLVVQAAWVPVLPPEDLARVAFDEVNRLVPLPSPLLSPDVSLSGYVNFETWLAVEPVAAVSATASIPGLSATVTASVESIEWSPGDGRMVVCTPWGALPPTPDFVGRAPCGYTYRFPSHPKVTHTDDLRYHGQVVLVWHATFVASDGTTGDLGVFRSVTPFAYKVREIQTVGSENPGG